MYFFLGIATSACLALLNYARYRDAIYPPVLQATLWLVIICMYGLFGEIELSGRIHFIIISGVIMFSVGSYIATYEDEHRPRMEHRLLHRVKENDLFLIILFVISAVALPLYLHRAYTLGQEGPYESSFRNLRDAMTREEQPEGFGLLEYAIVPSFVSTGLHLFLVLQNRARWRFLISLLISLAYASAYAGRTVFLSLFLMLSGILLATRRVSPIKAISVFGVAGMLVFVIVGIALDKGGTTFQALFDSDAWDSASALWDVVVFYMLAALPSFDMHMLSKEHYDLGVNTFRFLFAVLNRIGFEAEVVPTIKEFQGLPFTSNVYTVYRPYFDDFSIFGAIFIQLFLGLFHGSLYRNIGKGPVYIMLYSIFLYPLFMQFFHDQYFSVLSMWIQYGLALALYSYTSQRIWREEAV